MRGLPVALIAAALLAGCATPAPQPGEPAWIGGRMALKVAAHRDQPARSFVATFELRGSSVGAAGDAGELHLSAPLGARVASARWSPQRVALATEDGERFFPSLDALSRDAFGETLPLAALPDWLAGRPWPRAPHTATADGFAQLGFEIDTSRRGDGWIVARRSAPPAIDLRVKLDDPG